MKYPFTIHHGLIGSGDRFEEYDIQDFFMVVDFDQNPSKSLGQLRFIPNNEPFRANLRDGVPMVACQ